MSLSREQQQMLEVYGFDLMAQVEAMLRHVRQYQREVQRLRGLLGKGQTSTSDRHPVEAVRNHVAQLLRAGASFRDTLDDIEQMVEPAEAGKRPTSAR